MMTTIDDILETFGGRDLAIKTAIIGVVISLGAFVFATKINNTLKLIIYKIFFIDAKPGNNIVFTLLRKFNPYFTFETSGKRVVVITRASDMREILQQYDVFGNGNRYGMDPAFAPGFFLMARDTEPEHEHEKSIMKSILIRSDLPKVRKMAGDLARQNIKEAIAKGDGKIDAIATLSKLVPTQIVDKYFGFTPPSYEAMMRWSDALQGGFFYNKTKDDEIQKTCTEAGMEARKFIREELLPKKKAELKKNPDAQDPVSRMLRTAFVDEAKFDIERIVSNTVGLLVGCVETNNNAIIKCLDRLMAMPKAMKLAREAAKAGDDEKLIKICWEALRFNAPSQYLPRIVQKDFVFRSNKKFKKGDVVVCSHRSAFFDPDFVHKPNDFVIDRPDKIVPSFHFGSGKHICLGEHVSIQLMPMVIKEILLYKPVVKRVNGKVGELETRPGTPFLSNFMIEFSD